MADKRDAFEDLSPEQRLKMADMKAEGLKASDLEADVGMDASTPKGTPVTDDELAPERPVDGIFKFVVPEDADAEGFDIAVDKVSAGEVEADSLYVSGADPAITDLAPLDGPDEIVGDLSIDDAGFGDDGLDV